MSSRFACPNPGCNYVFDPSQFPPGPLLLSCPVCRIQFPYQPPAAVAPPPPPAAMPWQNAPAAAAPQSSGWPEASSNMPTAPYDQPAPAYGGGYPAGYPSTNAPPASAEPPMIRRTEAPRRGGGLMVWGVLLVIISAGLITTVLMVRGTGRAKIAGIAPEYTNVSLFNFQYKPPTAPWESDSSTIRERMKINVVVMQRQDPPAWFAIAAQDYKDRQPRDIELEDGLRSRLKVFENVESEVIPDATWAGQPAKAYRFEGDYEGVLIAGMAYTMRYQGIGYWYFAWTPQEQFADQKPMFDDLRERVKLSRERVNWTEKRANTREFVHGPTGFTVVDSDGVWKQLPPIEYKEDDQSITNAIRATLLQLMAEPQGYDKDFRRLPINQARLTLMQVDGDEAPMTVARRKVEEFMKEEYGEEAGASLKLANDDAPLPEGVSMPEADIVRLIETSTTDRDKKTLHVISAIKARGKVAICWVSCEGRMRAYWEPYLIKIAGTLKAGEPKKKAED